jgi:HEPN domain-containing protein
VRDQLCFFAQQTAEKYLKALLEELGLTIPKTHDLERLLDLLILRYPELRSERRGGRALTPFAVTTRYPGENATKRQAASAPRWADGVRSACRVLLSLPP